MKNYATALSLLCLAFSIVVGSWLISGKQENKEVQAAAENQEPQDQLLTREEVVAYLGISLEELDKMSYRVDEVGDIESELPFIKIGKMIYYPKKAVDRWLRDIDATIIQ